MNIAFILQLIDGKQSKKNMAYLICLLICLIAKASCAYVPMEWRTSPYFRAGRLTYTPTPMSLFLDQNITITYTSPLSDPPTQKVALGIVDFNFKLSDSNLYLFARDITETQSGFVLKIQANNDSYFLGPLGICYMTLDPSFTLPFSIGQNFNSWQTDSELQGPFTKTYLSNFTATTGLVLDTSHSFTMVVFQHAFDLYDISQGCFDLNISASVYNASFYYYEFLTSCSLKLGMYGFTRLIIDQTALMNNGYHEFLTRTLVAPYGNYTSLTLTVTPFVSTQNEIYGLRSFSFNDLPSISFSTHINETTNISIHTLMYNSLSFQCFIYIYAYCPPEFPYLIKYPYYICFDSCPLGWYPNAVKMCLPCDYSCLSCSSYSVCTSCNNTNNRQLNGTSCKPKPGYFQNSTAMAVLCSSFLPSCDTCTSATSCTSCISGFYVAANQTCQLCNNTIPSCLTCKTISSTLYCNSCAAGLVIDSTNSSCISCPAGFQQSGGECLSICGDGILVGSEQCDDGNNVDGDGCNADCTIGNNNGCFATQPFIDPISTLCTDQCPNGFYAVPINYTCSLCSYTCQTCSNITYCLTCNSSNNRYLNGSQCLPKPGFFENNSAVAPACISHCNQCLSQTQCSSCEVGFYLLSNNTCQFCNNSINNCIQCTGTTLTCTNCSIGWYILNNSCKTKCGDGILVGSEQCDDGNNVDGDGCNSDCTIGNNNGCSASSSFRDPLTNICTTICSNGYFPNETTFTCNQCSFSCQTCTNQTVCLTCNASNHRELNGTSCVPMNGYFQNNTSIAPACVSPCSICTSETDCLTCLPQYYFASSICNLCSSAIGNCSQCTYNSTPTCTKCKPEYILNKTTNACDQVPCADINCIACPNSYSQCSQCRADYSTISGGCHPICGDFVVMPQEQCDDGNVIQNDGCSKSCSVQYDFVCETNASLSQGSTCYYTGTIEITKIQLNKLQNKNAIQIQLDMQPNNLAFLNEIDFMEIVNVKIANSTVSNYKIQRNPNGTLTFTLEYNEDIQNQPLNITINPFNSQNIKLSRAQTSYQSLTIIPDDNKAAYFYTPNVYKLQKVAANLAFIAAASGLGIFLIGIIAGKYIGVEMMSVIQISFFSLMSISQLNPCFAALSSLWLVNGYNNIPQNKVYDSLAPIRAKGIGMFSAFNNNFNFTVAIILIPLFISLIAFILSKTVMKNNEKVVKVFERALGQYTFMGLLFGGYLISISFILQIMYGIKNMSDLIGKTSIASSIVLLLLFIGYFILKIVKPELFGEFTKQLKIDKISSKQYNIMMIEKIIVGVGLVVMMKTNVGAVFPLAFALLSGAFIVFKLPYLRKYNNVRQISNMIIVLVIMGIYLAYGLTDSKTKNSSNIFFYLPLIVCALLILCVLYNGAAICYNIYNLFKNLKYGDKSYESETKQIQNITQQQKMILQTYEGQLPSKFLNTSRRQALIGADNNFELFEIKKLIKLKLQGQKLDPNTTRVIDERELANQTPSYQDI